MILARHDRDRHSPAKATNDLRHGTDQYRVDLVDWLRQGSPACRLHQSGYGTPLNVLLKNSRMPKNEAPSVKFSQVGTDPWIGTDNSLRLAPVHAEFKGPG
jgi:hypothetical protein